MRIYTVIGSVVSTVKNDGLTGAKLLVVAPLEGGGPSDPIVAVDAVGAGRGEVVLVVTGGAARFLPETRNAPVDAAIVAIVDRVESEGWTSYRKD
jgi:microcompartment protein CcmK/EutM